MFLKSPRYFLPLYVSLGKKHSDVVIILQEIHLV